jgi:hypothetical protein
MKEYGVRTCMIEIMKEFYEALRRFVVVFGFFGCAVLLASGMYYISPV